MSESVFELLRKRYPAPAWAFLEEVRNGTGYGRVTRTADALAMSLYPSRGLHLHGFEVKVSRADWIKELRDPDKAEEIAKHCHFWWLVIDKPEIVQNGELPATWGLLVSDGKRLTAKQEPTFNKEALPPTHKFLGAILRKVCSTSTDQVRIDRARRDGHDAGWKEGVEHGQNFSPDGVQWTSLQSRHDELKQTIDAFEEKSGLSLNRYTGGKIAEAVRLLTSGWDSPQSLMKRIAEDAIQLSDQAKKLLSEIEASDAAKRIATTPDELTTGAEDAA